ncbi:hypothetical protein Val02_11350 [Virgisporangium aliadipatigenens]|uniref:Carrier domain-containing protein n=1 Tax=Virgisporangium aliadipatigenens TaxID=741659 RepID=A0A8J3YFJ6_9ACTN|nr:phosphopantetheine-binding protein [Virgisporangium aliadipatigenens]GIJ44249.1 hypothetical protein Val02_11350 [Virgisporangium aliadipatigenens]
MNLDAVRRALVAHPQVRSAHIEASIDHTDGTLALVAYVVPVEAGADPAEWTEWIARRQDLDGTPLRFVLRETLPVDTFAWVGDGEEPAPAGPADDRPVAPRDVIEEVLIDMWERELGVNPIGVFDSFLELGGHSLAAIRIVNRVRRAFRTELPYDDLLSGPTVAELAKRIVADEVEPGRTARIAAVHLKVRGLSAEQLRQMLTATGGRVGT